MKRYDNRIGLNKTAIENHTFLTESPIPQTILRLSIPTVISMLATSIYNMVDTYFVSKIDISATVAVGLAFTVMTLLQAMGFFFGQGSGIHISIRLGAKDIVTSEKLASTSLSYSIISGVLITILGIVFIDPLCSILGCSAKVLPYMKEYMMMIILSAPFLISSLMLSLQIRMQGMAKYSMIGIISGMALNIFLDPILMFTCGFGIMGAGLATLISQMASFFLLAWISKKRNLIVPTFSNVSYSLKYLKMIVSGGSPSLLRQGLGCVVVLTMNLCAAQYGDNVVAGMTITTRITFLLLSIITGLGQGFQPLCGFSFGAGLYSRIYEGLKFTIKVATLFLIVTGLIGYLFATEIASLFSSTPDAISVSSNALKWQFLVFPLEGVVIIGNIFLQTINRTFSANFMNVARKGIFFIPLMFVLPHFMGVGGIEMCQAISDTLTFILIVPILSKTISSISNVRNINLLAESTL